MKVYIRTLIILYLTVWGCSNLLAQESLSITLHVEKAGTLEKEINDKIAHTKQLLITDLTLTGEIGGDDIMFLQYLAGRDNPTAKLSSLDISEVNIVGGVPYSKKRDFYGNYTDITKDNEIGSCMFFNCNSLKYIKLPNTVTKIETFAFQIRSLKEIHLPESLKEVYGAFWGCDSLEKISISNKNPHFTVKDNVLFNKDKTELVVCPPGKMGSYTIPNSVTKIKCASFNECNKLIEIIISNSVLELDEHSISGCDNLTEIIIPNSVKNIQRCAIMYCYNLKKIVIPNSITYLDEGFLGGCPKLKELWLSIKKPINVYIDYDTIDSCVLYIPKGTYNEYYLAPGWGDFKDIREFDDKPTSNESVKPETLSISVMANGISINSNLEVLMSIYSIGGQLVYHKLILGHEQISLSKGVYIVVYDNYRQKVIVK